jgi:hypothetical protein
MMSKKDKENAKVGAANWTQGLSRQERVQMETLIANLFDMNARYWLHYVENGKTIKRAWRIIRKQGTLIFCTRGSQKKVQVVIFNTAAPFFIRADRIWPKTYGDF